MKNYLTIDVEDYFQVSAFESMVGGVENWGKYAPRVVDNTRVILELLERQGLRATFFILGWVAERFPNLVKEISAAGHEIGCHSYAHRLVYQLTPEEFQEDSRRAKEILEEITGTPIYGYRAPSYSITKDSLWALEILEELGFTYDSSIFPIRHDRYGLPDAPRFPHRHPGLRLVEYPISTANIFGSRLPVAGGGYFRLFPYWLTKSALQGINSREKQPFVFYLHPWEIDQEQPRFGEASRLSKFRHYNNLHKTLVRFQRLLQEFEFGPLPSHPSPGCPSDQPADRLQGLSPFLLEKSE